MAAIQPELFEKNDFENTSQEIRIKGIKRHIPTAPEIFHIAGISMSTGLPQSSRQLTRKTTQQLQVKNSRVKSAYIELSNDNNTLQSNP